MSKEENKILPQLRFPEFENAGDWEEEKIKSVCEKPFSGGTPTSTKVDYYGGKIPFIRSAEINKEKTELFLTQLGLENSSAKMVNKGDVLLAMYGANSGDVGISKINGAINQAIICLRSKTNNTFLFHYLEHKKNGIIQKYLQGGQGNLSGDIIKSIELFFPENPKEQQKIANCLSSLDNVINAETEKLDLLQDHKKGLLQQLFPQQGESKPKYRFPEFVDDGDWDVSTLGDIAKFRRGSFPQPYGRAEWYDDENGMPFIQVYDVDTNLKIKPNTKRRISELAAEKSVFIAKGTVIITLQGSIGRVAITQYDAYIDRTLLLFEEFYKPLDKLFFAYVIQLLFEIEKEKAPGGIIKTITKEVLTNFNIYVPKIKEQQKIADCLSSVDELIESQQQKIEGLKAHKKGLLQQLFPKVNSL